ncbi:MAG TPA: DUF1552 domain-containing protein [Candidatus Acidoferrales bacterium]|nr:DUF1552 domain-containing protein [Candidatus Acidoferrales bacterium]
MNPRGPAFVTGAALPRRSILRGIGAAIGLPFLDAMAPAFAASSVPGKPPVRMAFFYVPNGVIMDSWNTDYTGPLQSLPRALKALEPYKQDILQIGNLTHNTGRALLDGSGDHGRCCGSYLTGVQVKKSVVEIKSSVSFDQIVAKEAGKQTRFPSLELGMDDARQAGECDTGYSCAYTNNLAWRSETQPLPPILNPRALFERMFGTGRAMTAEQRAQQMKDRRSILDFVSEGTRQLESGLGPSDRRKLDEYLSSIREVERQLEVAEKDNSQIDPHMDKPYGVPADFSEHFKLMSSMIAIAFQADLTRVVTFLITREGSQRPYREIGIADGHHPLTHHRNQAELMEKVRKINEYHVQQFAGFVEKMKSSREGDRSLLDNCMIVYGAGLSDGNAHLHEDLPTIIVGRGGNTIKSGRRIVARRETPMCNLFLSMMERMGVHMERFGDSTGRFQGLDLA